MSEVPSGNREGMNEEQEKFLAYLETEFKDRYTEADEEFKVVWETDLPPPPIFHDWERRCDDRSNYIHRRGYKDYHNYKQRRYEAYNRPGRRTY